MLDGAGSKRNKMGQLLMCAKKDQEIKYYQDATIGNRSQKDTTISLTLILAESTTKERNHKHPVFFFFFF